MDCKQSSIHRSMGSAPVGAQCPLTSSLGEFLGYWVGSGILGYSPCWCPLPFPSPSISQCFSIHSSSPAIGFHSCFFFTTDVSAPIRLTLHLLMVSFQAWDWLWYQMLWSQRRCMGCAWSRNLDPNLCPDRGRTSELGIQRPRTLPLDYRAPPPFSRLL